MSSKKVVVAADGLTATITDATYLDAVTTLISTDSAVTGVLGLVQKGAIFAAGMAAQNYRLGRGLNFIEV